MHTRVTTVMLIISMQLMPGLATCVTNAQDQSAGQDHRVEGLEKGLEKTKAEKVRQDDWLRKFATMPAERRFEIWQNSYSHPKSGFRAARLRALVRFQLIVAGVDAVPYLSQAVHSEDKTTSFEAVRILADMDRFVPKEKFTVPFPPRIFSPAGGSGSLDPYMTVDGRRIGKVGLEAIDWAISQSPDKDLSMYSSLLSGRFLDSLRQQPVDVLMVGWRKSAIKARGRIGFTRDEFAILSLRAYTDAVLEKGKEAIPRAAAMLDDVDPWVRGEARQLLLDFDRDVVRLRTLPEGSEAIDKLHRTLLRSDMKPLPRDHKQIEKEWDLDASDLLKDNWPTNAGSLLGALAFALSSLYSDSVTQAPPQGVLTAYEAIPKMREFVRYLTVKDPFFPSWGFVASITGAPQDDIFHPNYMQRIKRFHDAWKEFTKSMTTRLEESQQH